MELALITAQQVAVLFLLIGTGMVAVKTGVLKLENKQALSNLLVYIIVPAMVVNSYRMEFSAQILRNLLAAFGMSVLSVLLGTVITLLLTARKTGSRMPIFRFACIFSNAAYMGFPLISALFGSEGLLYASAYVTVFNILLWTLGYGLVSGGSSVKEVARRSGAHPGTVCHCGGAGHLSAADPASHPDHSATGTVGRSEHPAVHAHYRDADCRR